MEPFYLLVFIAGLLVASLLLQVLRGAADLGARGCYFQRRQPFVDDRERLCLDVIEQAIGGNYRVLSKVSALSVLEPEAGSGRRRRRKGVAALRGKTLDFLICAPADLYPLCAVTTLPDDAGRADKRAQALIASACADAALPLVSVPLQERYELNDLRRRLVDAIESADVQITSAVNHHAEEEEAALAALAAAMQEPDDLRSRRPARR